jgi:UDP-N-acetylglucosamine:LPS N-acetylglucosamine transferase
MDVMKICVACSAGGHLTEIRQLLPAFGKHSRFFLVPKREDSSNLSRSEQVHFITDTGTGPISVIKNFFETLSIILKERPRLVVSTGAGAAVAACWIGKLLGAKIIFIESYCRIHEPSRSGKLVYPIANLFLVQWPEMQKHYPKAKFWGAVF